MHNGAIEHATIQWRSFPWSNVFINYMGMFLKNLSKNCRSFTWHKRAKSVDIYTKTKFIQNFLKLFIDITFCFFTLSNIHNLTISWQDQKKWKESIYNNQIISSDFSSLFMAYSYFFEEKMRTLENKLWAKRRRGDN